jgi:hypothetical protein
VRRKTLPLLLLLSALLPGGAAGQAPQAPPPAPKSPLAPLTVTAIEIRPANPGPDTLCQLAVKVKNGGTRKASALVFAVRVNGLPLAVYKRQVYLQVIDPGTTATVGLFNLWTTETGRPLPKDGQLRLEVTLAEARWVEVKTEGTAGTAGTAGGTEVVTPGEAVPSLPVSASLVVPLQGAPAKSGKVSVR